MKDNEIIQALECCSNYNDCGNCDFEPKDNKKNTVGCCLEIMKEVLDLINRLQAENERLQTEEDNLIKTFAECQKDVIKEFAGRLKEHAESILDWDGFVSVDCIDDLVKEMDGEDK